MFPKLQASEDPLSFPTTNTQIHLPILCSQYPEDDTGRVYTWLNLMWPQVRMCFLFFNFLLFKGGILHFSPFYFKTIPRSYKGIGNFLKKQFILNSFHDVAASWVCSNWITEEEMSTVSCALQGRENLKSVKKMELCTWERSSTSRQIDSSQIYFTSQIEKNWKIIQPDTGNDVKT